MNESQASRQIREPLADRRSELAAVARAGRADHEAAASLEDERLLRRRRVEARFRDDRIGLGEAVGLACPARNLLDQARLGLARLVRIDLGTRVMRPDLQAVDGVGKRVYV